MANTIIVPRRREDFFAQNGEPTARFINWIELVTGQTNLVSVESEDNSASLPAVNTKATRNTARINSVELRQFEIVKPVADTTTEPYQILICKNTSPITVTLDPNAIEDDEVHIKRRGESITVVGVIDGVSDRVINVLNWNAHYIFDGTDWSAL